MRSLLIALLFAISVSGQVTQSNRFRVTNRTAPNPTVGALYTRLYLSQNGKIRLTVEAAPPALLGTGRLPPSSASVFATVSEIEGATSSVLWRAAFMRPATTFQSWSGLVPDAGSFFLTASDARSWP